MPFPTQLPFQTRSKLKRRCKRQSEQFLNRKSFLLQRPKLILSQILQIDYNKESKPEDFKPSEIQTFGSMTDDEIKEAFQKLISREMLNNIIIDTMKTEIESAKDQYRVKDVLQIIVRGRFYKYLLMKTQPSKFLFNNRTTEINIKTIVSGILIIMTNKLTLKNLSDVVLYYRLEEALYETGPYGLPFEFEKIIKAMKKVERNITADKFANWERRMIAVNEDVKFLEPYHFIYLLSLSQPISKKRQALLDMERRDSKIEKQTQMMNLMKEKNNFINLETQRTNWKAEIKVKGLSFQQKSQQQYIVSMSKEFVDLRKRIISHKRVKSAYITSKAVQSVKQDLRKNNQKQNEYLLDMQISKPKKIQKQRTLLKKHNKLQFAAKQFEHNKREQHNKFSQVYDKELQSHNLDKLSDQVTQDNNQEIHQNGMVKVDQEAVDIYSHHMEKMFVKQKHRSFTQAMSLSTAGSFKSNMLKWL